MPSRRKHDKAHARRTAQQIAAPDIEIFLELLNKGRVRLVTGDLFDAGVWPTHHQLREKLLTFALCLVDDKTNDQLAWLKTGEPIVDAWTSFESERGTAPREGESAEAALARHVAAATMASLIRNFFQDHRHRGYTCLSQCARDGCARWFFALTDKQECCEKACARKRARDAQRRLDRAKPHVQHRARR